MYRPRWRGVMIAAITTWVRACRPPIPSPCSTRNPISCDVSVARPHSREPIRKIPIALCTSSFLE